MACPRCRAIVKAPCTGPGTAIYGVHVERAIAAGHLRPALLQHPIYGACNVDAGGIVLRAPAPRTGVRKMAQRAQVPLMRCYSRLPWEQTECIPCGGWGRCSDEGPPDPCGVCRGTGITGMSLAHEDRVDGLTAPPSLAYAVPPEHRARWGRTITLYRRAMTAAALGTITVYDLKGR